MSTARKETFADKRDSVISDALYRFAQRYWAGNEDGKVDADIQAIRFVHRTSQSETNRAMYKRMYEDMKGVSRLN